jgi:hypothetical protein
VWIGGSRKQKGDPCCGRPARCIRRRTTSGSSPESSFRRHLLTTTSRRKPSTRPQCSNTPPRSAYHNSQRHLMPCKRRHHLVSKSELEVVLGISTRSHRHLLPRLQDRDGGSFYWVLTPQERDRGGFYRRFNPVRAAATSLACESELEVVFRFFLPFSRRHLPRNHKQAGGKVSRHFDPICAATTSLACKSEKEEVFTAFQSFVPPPPPSLARASRS